MSRMPAFTFRVLAAALILFFGVSRGHAQAPPATPPPSQDHAKDHAKDDSKKTLRR